MLYSIHTIRKYCKYSVNLLHDTYILMHSWNLFVLDFVRRFFVSCAQIFEAYAVRTLMKFGCDWRKISRKSKCRKIPRVHMFKSRYKKSIQGGCSAYVFLFYCTICFLCSIVLLRTLYNSFSSFALFFLAFGTPYRNV